jgi:hypothetical protein
MSRYNNGRTPEVFPRRIIVEREAAKAEQLAQELVRRADKGLPLAEPAPEGKRMCFNVSLEMHRACRVEAAKRGTTLQGLILDALHAFGIRE